MEGIATGPQSDVEMPSYVEVWDEPFHPTVFENEFIRVYRTRLKRHEENMYHRHSQPSFFLILTAVKVINSIMGREPREVELKAGSFFWANHAKDPMIHKVKVLSEEFDVLDLEVKPDRPVPTNSQSAPPLPDTTSLEMCLENDWIRVYRIKPNPSERFLRRDMISSISSPSFFVALKHGETISGDVVERGDFRWGDGHGEKKRGSRGVDDMICNTEIMVVELK